MTAEEALTLFANIPTVEASDLPERWWTSETKEAQKLVEIACFVIYLNATEEDIRRAVRWNMLQIPGGHRVRVVNPPGVARARFVGMYQTRFCRTLRDCDRPGEMDMVDETGVVTPVLPVILLVYEAERGSPGYW